MAGGKHVEPNDVEALGITGLSQRWRGLVAAGAGGFDATSGKHVLSQPGFSKDVFPVARDHWRDLSQPGTRDDQRVFLKQQTDGIQRLFDHIERDWRNRFSRDVRQALVDEPLQHRIERGFEFDQIGLALRVTRIVVEPALGFGAGGNDAIDNAIQRDRVIVRVVLPTDSNYSKQGPVVQRPLEKQRLLIVDDVALLNDVVKAFRNLAVVMQIGDVIATGIDIALQSVQFSQLCNSGGGHSLSPPQRSMHHTTWIFR